MSENSKQEHKANFQIPIVISCNSQPSSFCIDEGNQFILLTRPDPSISSHVERQGGKQVLRYWLPFVEKCEKLAYLELDYTAIVSLGGEDIMKIWLEAHLSVITLLPIPMPYTCLWRETTPLCSRTSAWVGGFYSAWQILFRWTPLQYLECETHFTRTLNCYISICTSSLYILPHISDSLTLSSQTSMNPPRCVVPVLLTKIQTRYNVGVGAKWKALWIGNSPCYLSFSVLLHMRLPSLL